MMAGYETVRELRGNLPPIRCSCCNRLLYRGVAQTIEIKCPKCGKVQTVKGLETERLHLAGNYTGRLSRADNIYSASRVVTDSAGRIVALPNRPQRVIALNASNLGLYYATGGEVVARTATSLLPPELKEKVKAVPTVGLPLSPDVAGIIAIKPDLVLGMHAPMHHSVAAALEQNGIPVLLQALEDYTDVLKTLRLYGELSGNPAQADKKIEAIENKRKELLQRHYGKIPPKVLILWHNANGIYTALSNSFVGNLVKRLGGVNVADLAAAIGENLHYTPFCLDAITMFQPDIILIGSHSFATNNGRSSAEFLDAQPKWQRLTAVQRNAVYRLPFHLFAVNPGPQLEDALTVLADFLYERRAL